MKAFILLVCLMFANRVRSFPQNQPQKLKMPGPEVQNLMLGKWSTRATYAPSPEMPNGGTAAGTEIWRLGPGGMSVIEESHEKNANGDYEGLGVVWWDSKAQGQRFLWCDTDNPDGCYVSKEVGKWNGTSLEWKEEQEHAGKNRMYSEVFRDITPTSFTQVLGEGEPGEPAKTTVTIRATKLSGGTTNRMEASSGERDLASAMAERDKAMLAGDGETVERLTADEYVQTDISGYVQDRSTWLNEYFRPLATLIKAGKFRWDTYEGNDVQIHRFGDTAVVTGAMALKGTGAKPSGHTWVESSETSFAGTLRFTRVWVNRDGGWRLAALQNALMQPSNDDRNDAGRGAQSHGNSEAAKLVALANEWTDAINSHNRQKLDVLMASDFALYHWNGELGAARSQWLDNLFNHIKITENTLTDAAPQVYGDFGVVTSVGDWIGTFDSKPFSQKCIVVDTWRKSDSRWKVVRRTSRCYTEDSASGTVAWTF